MRQFNQIQYFKSFSKIYEPYLSIFANKTVLITGANGLIGGTLLDFLMFLNQEYTANITINVLVREDLKKYPFFDYSRINILRQSVTDKIEFEGVLDYIFHAASNAHPKVYDLYPVETAITNIQGTTNLLELCRHTKARLVFISSSEVYGELEKGKTMHDENSYGYINILSARSCYSESKRMAETLISSYIKEYDVNALSVRPAYIFGPRFSEKNTRADVEFIKRCLHKEDIIMKSEGLQERSYCYVLDCVSAILLVAARGNTGEAYNISSDSGNVKLVTFARELADIAKVKLSFDLKGVKGGSPVKNSLLLNEKIKSLGWVERFSLTEGIRDTFNILL